MIRLNRVQLYRGLMCLLLGSLMVGCLPDHQSETLGNYAAWSSHADGEVWTELAETAVQETTLTAMIPEDADKFCPRYDSLVQSDRIQFWVGLLSAMAEHESDFDPMIQYTESLIQDSNGHDVVSRGLLQLSLESARQTRYGCTIERDEDLHEPAVNLDCSAQILNTWVSRDGSIAGTANSRLGGARYWSTLWHSRDSLGQIRRFTRQLRVCAT